MKSVTTLLIGSLLSLSLSLSLSHIEFLHLLGFYFHFLFSIFFSCFLRLCDKNNENKKIIFLVFISYSTIFFTKFWTEENKLKVEKKKHKSNKPLVFHSFYDCYLLSSTICAAWIHTRLGVWCQLLLNAIRAA